MTPSISPLEWLAQVESYFKDAPEFDVPLDAWKKEIASALSDDSLLADPPASSDEDEEGDDNEGDDDASDDMSASPDTQLAPNDVNQKSGARHHARPRMFNT